MTDDEISRKDRMADVADFGEARIVRHVAST